MAMILVDFNSEFQSPKIGSVVSNDMELLEYFKDLNWCFNPLKSGQLFQMRTSETSSRHGSRGFQSPKIGSVVSNER